MKIAITGATGVLGKILINKIIDSNIEVFKFKGDLTSLGDLNQWLSNINPDIIFHFGALVAVDIVKNEPFKAYEVNVGGTINLLSAVRALKIRPWIFYASSSHVYKSSEHPINEQYETDPITTYGQTKLIGEKVCESYTASYGLPICIGRIFSFYHHTQKPPFLYPSILQRFKSEDLSKPFKLRGANCIRDIVNAEKIIDIILKLQQVEFTGIVNIAGGQGISIGEFVKKIHGGEILVESLDDDCNSLVADISKLRETLNNSI
jgi:nucleoside-diphosphate-sugar epimerase